jgi:GntR family transcriptional regulator/MocR family aminotransferase
VPTLDQHALAHLVATGAFERQVRRGRLEYRRRRAHLLDRLAGLPQHVRLGGVAAGLHAVVLLRGGPPTERRLVAAADAHGVAVEGLSRFWHDQPRATGLVVGYSRPAADRFPAAVDRLVDVLSRES